MVHRILAIDLGTTMGMALFEQGKLVQSNYVTLGGVRGSLKGMLGRAAEQRFSMLAALLNKLPQPDVLVYEDVQFASYLAQAQLWSGFRAVLLASPMAANAKLKLAVPVATLHAFARKMAGDARRELPAALVNPKLLSALAVSKLFPDVFQLRRRSEGKKLATKFQLDQLKLYELIKNEKPTTHDESDAVLLGAFAVQELGATD